MGLIIVNAIIKEMCNTQILLLSGLILFVLLSVIKSLFRGCTAVYFTLSGIVVYFALSVLLSVL